MMQGDLGHVVEAVEKAQSHWQARRGETAGAGGAAAMTVALTREAGTPATTIANELGRRLGWQVYDGELVEQIARQMGLRASLLESVDERRQSWILESMQGLGAAQAVTEAGFVRHLIETVVALAAHGQCVIVGRGAAQMLPRATTLRVRLVGLLEDRIEATRQRLNVTQKEATAWVDRTDRERAQFVRDHFQKDPTDPRNYDLLLNCSRWSVGECADLVQAALGVLIKRA